MQDSFGRKLDYVRISVTDRCNYRCRYCMPAGGIERIPRENILSYGEIFFLIRVLEKLGVKKIRFTGGEPLVRKGMVPFLEKVCIAFPALEIALTTNGFGLERFAVPLARAGLSGLNLSLDTLDAKKFTDMTRGGDLQKLLDGIEALLSAFASGDGETPDKRDSQGAVPLACDGPQAQRAAAGTVPLGAWGSGQRPEVLKKTQLKLNAVLIRGFNDAAAAAELANFALQRKITPRFIEFMPLDSSVWNRESFVPFEEILPGLFPPGSDWREESGGSASAGPARYYADSAGRRVGVVSAVSRHFCASCNRLRVTSSGEMRACLFSGKQVSLRGALRARDEAAVCEGILAAAALKPETGMLLPRDAGRMYKIGG